ncbi:DUF488 domain-containing protein [Chitinophaga nivalis]|uniref:DUF488 family protein n=1 Tax=Chitinophaga nivalis TaxID=2991709 RepID=A0ABT3IS15_9BACT|nr:DUF488 family protein [Chitinophaga nivalis]MCW3463562.1 DUF488 family protein [Chitinophaga nivalis]MCW3486748.1 DUF488 family protein [Chitinophaga nivalis]
MIRIKRVYDDYAESDGYRVLVDRLWPRGLSKEKAHIDEWARVIAPSDALRKWFHHESGQFAAFKTKYLAELQEQEKQAWLADLRKKARHQQVTLLFGAKDTVHNQAQVLLEVLKK